ncbi:hypothetical protein [Pelagicoccus albus]|uniref:Uncharacterized protein n=1 Tax=Pelagicoccus albus TaxID=415222 RepID=A0A7X1E802_9BACT|nr:hypothetical protein [Pelagicoccus albus]MBC2605736.1 hypothetical protein [Pelagicoccus albus]
MKNQWVLSITLGLLFGFLSSQADRFGEPFTSIALLSFIPLAAIASHDYKKRNEENIAQEKVGILEALGNFEWNEEKEEKMKRGIIHLLCFGLGIVVFYLILE